MAFLSFPLPSRHLVLRQSCDFLVGVSATACVEVNNALLASAPGHSLCRRLVRAVAASHAARRHTARLPAALQALQRVPGTIERTGPGLATRVILGYAFGGSGAGGGAAGDGTPSGLALAPPHCFYPVPNWLRGGLVGASATDVAAAAARAAHATAPPPDPVDAALFSAYEARRRADWRLATSAAPLADARVSDRPAEPDHDPCRSGAWPVVAVHLWDCAWQQESGLPPAASPPDEGAD